MFNEEMARVKLMLDSLVEFCEVNEYEIVTINLYRETAAIIERKSSRERIVEFSPGIESWV